MNPTHVFVIEFYHAGGACWVRSLWRNYRYRADAFWWRSRWWVGRDAVLPIAYGLFRRYVDTLERLGYVIFEGAPVKCDGVRLVEVVDGDTKEVARWRD